MVYMTIKKYTELEKLKTFKERFDYLSEGGIIGDQTFGGSRFLNQDFYQSREWQRIRDKVILRDNGCDLGILDRPIFGKIVIHHMIPIRKDDLLYQTPFLVDPEYLICCSYLTHQAIHYGSFETLPQDYTPRRPNDTCPWKEE